MALQLSVETEFGMTVEYWRIAHNEEQFLLNETRVRGRLDAYKNEEAFRRGDKPIRKLSKFYNFSSGKDVVVTRSIIENQLINPEKYLEFDFSNAVIVED